MAGIEREIVGMGEGEGGTKENFQAHVQREREREGNLWCRLLACLDNIWSDALLDGRRGRWLLGQPDAVYIAGKVLLSAYL